MLYWHEDPADLEALFNYCGRDAEVERIIYKSLSPLPPTEREVWLLDQRINLRGVPVDIENVGAIVHTVRAREAEQLEQFQEATLGAVSGPRSYVKLKEWVNDQTGLELTSINKEVTQKLLDKGGLPGHVRQALEIKAELSKSSVAKFEAMRNRCNKDFRFRGMAQYHGAATGRWAGRGIQLQNLPRDSYDETNWEIAMGFIQNGDLEGLSILFDDLYFTASRMIRGSFKAKTGGRFICADFSAIEGRALAHLAGENWVIQAYLDGADMYKMAYSVAFGVPYDEVDKNQRQIGKVSELACGYGGGPGAVRAFGGGEGWTDEEIYQKIVTPWREARPAICRFWYGIEKTAWKALEEPGQIYTYRGIKFIRAKDFLKCLLPSGRVLHYYKPQIQDVKTPWGEYKKQITYMGMKVVEGKTTTQWARIATRGPKLVENIVQGYCRDLLAEAMLRLEDAGYPVCLHVHDEAAAEMPKGKGSLEEFERIMSEVPVWAKGMPIEAKGWTGERYRK